MLRTTTYFLVILGLCAAPIFAVDLQNEDSKSYNIEIQESSTTTNSSINGGSTQVSVCSSCTIKVVGGGSATASGSATIVIKDGQISVR